MQPAVERLARGRRRPRRRRPALTLWTNRDGSAVASGAAFVDLLVGQVSSPVRWDLCMASFATAGVTGLSSSPRPAPSSASPSAALKGVPTVAVKTPDDLPAAIELIESA